MVNYILLDIDGVLNNSNHWKHLRFLGHNDDGALLAIDDSQVDNLKYIYDKFNVKIILSSSWRNDMNGLRAITKILGEKGMFIYKHTPELSDKMFTFAERRKQEILKWVRDNVEKDDYWLALDDVNLQLDVNNFVKTKPAVGFDTKKRDRVAFLFEQWEK